MHTFGPKGHRHLSYLLHISCLIGVFLSLSLFQVDWASAQSCGTPPSGLVSLWRGEGSSLDALGINHGVLEGGVSFVPGQSGSAFSFDGVDDTLRIPNSASLTLNDSFTVEFWFSFPDDIVVGSPRYEAGTIFLNKNWHDSFGIANGLGYLEVGYETPRVNSTTASWLADTWYHTAVTYDAGEYRLYVDGNLETTLTRNDSLFDRPDDIYFSFITATDFNPPTWFEQRLDEIAIYNRALTAPEVASRAGNCAEQCFIDAPVSVYENESFDATVSCTSVASGVYGFELGTSSSGDASTSATGYAPGSFVTDVGSDYLEASNTLNLYSVSRRAPATIATGDFTLGSVSYTATAGITANTSASLSLDNLLLGDMAGGPVTVPFTNSTAVTILDLRTVDLTVASDGSVQQVRDVTATLDTIARGPQTGAGTSLILSFTDVLPTTNPTLTADIDSHLMCSSVLNLTSSVTSMTTTLKAGDVVLNGSDPSPRINLYDAVTIGLALGSAGTGEEDVNGDGTVNIFDLIHVGRNYGAISGVCA